jgi:hypothetical protein
MIGSLDFTLAYRKASFLESEASWASGKERIKDLNCSGGIVKYFSIRVPCYRHRPNKILFAISAHLAYQPRQNILVGVASFAIRVDGILAITVIEEYRGRHSLPRSKIFRLFMPQIIETFELQRFSLTLP